MSDKNQDWVVYEHPLNERLRTLLRLEFLMETASAAMEREQIIDSRMAVEAFIHTLNVLERGEVRSEVIKELDRLSTETAYMGARGVWSASRVQEETDRCRQLLRRVGEPDAALGQELREDELLGLITQRFGVGAGTCNFDLPSYHRWLSRPYDERRADMQRWYDSFADLRAAVTFALRVQRDAGAFADEVAEGGSWQQRTPYDSRVTQMLRLQAPIENGVIPEISGNRHLVTIRFLRQPDTRSRPEPVGTDVSFRMARCTL
ncbi:MAG: cell division protein ZapD [Halorhodospira halophila]|uniref:cell division protein ZapD n=1 Tax=Halorhodospira TaxID=85108 RepID=UPI001EE8CCD5|nr:MULTISPECIES: cell division protein ZapD [Halorhodospira]MCC3751403.1 cell division protein ZapD [Halorhodospira halophila]MCG5527544.1 cell division protein ZapD [Halorhodospira halophila]MCG5544371.1 cell division protein ZapD [Halorhodospira sp. 9628]